MKIEVVFGDNQFFGINHMSQQKAAEQAEKFRDLGEIVKVYDIAYSAGLRSFMLNSNSRANEICNYFRSNTERFPDIAWYPSIPYPHKYANMVSEHGILGAITQLVKGSSSISSLFSAAIIGSVGLLTKDPVRLMKVLVDLEMNNFHGLNIKTVFLQNIVVDLLLGLDLKDVFVEYCAYVKSKYGVPPGFITQNLPELHSKLVEWKIEDVLICASINKLGYLMSPSVDSYINCLSRIDKKKYKIMAMSTLASGAIPPVEAYDFIKKLELDYVVFGASSQRNIASTLNALADESN